MIDAGTRRIVRERARGRCEYCLLPEDMNDIPFHVEHVIAKQNGGEDDVSNLALACDRCNLNKGPNLSSIDPETNAVVHLFHPRKHEWSDQFAVSGPMIEGVTPTGRATVFLLRMNAPRRVQLRRELQRRRGPLQGR